MSKKKEIEREWDIGKVQVLCEKWAKVPLEELTRELGINSQRIRAMVRQLRKAGKEMPRMKQESRVAKLAIEAVEKGY